MLTCPFLGGKKTWNKCVYKMKCVNEIGMNSSQQQHDFCEILMIFWCPLVVSSISYNELSGTAQSKLVLDPTCWFSCNNSSENYGIAAALLQGRGGFPLPWGRAEASPMGLLGLRPSEQTEATCGAAPYCLGMKPWSGINADAHSASYPTCPPQNDPFPPALLLILGPQCQHWSTIESGG